MNQAWTTAYGPMYAVVHEPGHCISEEYEVSAVHVDNMGLVHNDEAWQIFVLKSERVMGMGYLMVLVILSLIGA